MAAGGRWSVRDAYKNEIYLSDERWEHIVTSHPEMSACEEQLKQTIRNGTRKQDLLNPSKYRYSRAFADLAEDNTHIVAIVLFRMREEKPDSVLPNNYVVTAYQKEIDRNRGYN